MVPQISPPTLKMGRRSNRKIVSDERMQKTVNSWQEFERELRSIRKRLRQAKPGTMPRLLFRGQESSRWPLSTTLERRGRDEMSFSDYYRLIWAARPQVESLVGTTWGQMPEFLEVEQ